MPLELVYQGETSNYYRNPDFPHLKFVERTDTFTIDDVIFPDKIPFKGVALTQISNSWMKLLEKAGILQTPIIASDATSLAKLGVSEDFCGRMIVVQDYTPIPIECIVRGYYVKESKSWDAYKKHCNMYGNVLPPGLKDSQKLPHPIYTPSAKGNINEPDSNISFADTIPIVKKYLLENVELNNEEMDALYAISFSLAQSIRSISMKAYKFAHAYALQKGIIIADAKLEFGTAIDSFSKKRKLVVISEAFTPDSCRLWGTKSYQIGKPQPSLDKQIIKRYVRDNLKWDSITQSPPKLPKQILLETSDAYWDMYKKLFNKDFVGVTSDIAWDLNFAHQTVLI